MVISRQLHHHHHQEHRKHTHRNSETGRAAGNFLETHNAATFSNTIDKTTQSTLPFPSAHGVWSPSCVLSHFYLARKPFQEGLSFPVF